MSFGFTVAQDNSQAVLLAVKKAKQRGLYKAGEYILGLSNQQAPIEDGDLIRSGAVSEINDDTVGVSYDTPYAVRQHEDLTYSHDPGRNAKFLSNACKAGAKTAGKIVGTEIARAVK